jgi:hypothetical protein
LDRESTERSGVAEVSVRQKEDGAGTKKGQDELEMWTRGLEPRSTSGYIALQSHRKLAVLYALLDSGVKINQDSFGEGFCRLR